MRSTENGNDSENHVRKIPTLNTTGDVTLRRGLIGDPRLFEWLKTVREGNPDRRTVTVTLLDGDRSEVCQWVLQGALPKRWTGPALSATDGEVAIEELKLVAERIDFQSL